MKLSKLAWQMMVILCLATHCSSADQQQTGEDIEGGQGEDGQAAGPDDQSQADAQAEPPKENLNAMQSKEVGGGAAVNNSVKDDFSASLVSQAPAVDTSLPPPPPPAPTQPTYMPGEVPPGWARTQNGLFINLNDLTNKATNYNEPPASWR